MTSFKKEPIPFEQIAVALSFSPYLDALIKESFRLAKFSKAHVHFIHVGPTNTATKSEFENTINKYAEADIDHSLIIEEGEIVDTILKICKNRRIDLIIVGAFEKENMFKYYLGSISRMICRKAKTSVLILKEPNYENKEIKRIVVNGAENIKTLASIETAIYLAQSEGLKEIDVVFEDTLHDISKIIQNDATEEEKVSAKLQLYEEAKVKMQYIIGQVPTHKNIHINNFIVTGKQGLCISNFARENDASLLILNSPDTQLGFLDRIFPHGIEYCLEDLPSNLLIVHSRNSA
jgi:nucleotide-binding universal stress UspA family protein